jgi:hypothetical protein
MQEPNENGQLSSEELSKLLAAIRAGESVTDGRVGGAKFRQLDWTEEIDPAKASRIQVIITNPAGEKEKMSLVDAIERIDEEQDLRPVNYTIKFNELKAKDDVNEIKFSDAEEEAFGGELELPLSPADAYVASTFEPSSDFFVAPVEQEAGTAPLYTVKDYVFDADRTTLSINGIDVIEAHTVFETNEDLGFSRVINGDGQMALLEGDTAEVKGYGVNGDEAIKGYEASEDKAKSFVEFTDEAISKANDSEARAKAEADEAIAKAKEQHTIVKDELKSANDAYGQSLKDMENAENENALTEAYDEAKAAQKDVAAKTYSAIALQIEISARTDARAAALKAFEKHITGLNDNKSDAESDVEDSKEAISQWKALMSSGGGEGKEMA